MNKDRDLSVDSGQNYFKFYALKNIQYYGFHIETPFFHFSEDDTEIYQQKFNSLKGKKNQ